MSFDIIIIKFECHESGYFVPTLPTADRSSRGSWFYSRSSHCNCIYVLSLCRTPLTSANDFTSTKSKIIQLCLELTSTVQKVSEAQTPPWWCWWCSGRFCLISRDSLFRTSSPMLKEMSSMCCVSKGHQRTGAGHELSCCDPLGLFIFRLWCWWW